MKKISKLQINSGRIMKYDELMTLRGGYEPAGSLCACKIGPFTTCTFNVACNYCYMMCTQRCSLWEEIICVGE